MSLQRSEADGFARAGGDGAESRQPSRQKPDPEEIKHESCGEKVAGDVFESTLALGDCRT
jgi:hypothetical protein